mmetsp:Transcript_45787/g.132559  ORF Transcript_45787/g.132559 Transcript_45787/m.132559 type:complete len:356 (-) Transcript_45787:38-1105(-)
MAAGAEPFASFEGGLAVITGGGDGMGRALCRTLASEGCSVALCDVNEVRMQETQAICEKVKTGQAKVTIHRCDVADEAQVLAFARAVAEQHIAKGRKVALFNNAGTSAQVSILGDRAAWDRCFNVCWSGVYFMTRAFLPMLLESAHGYVVNTSSVCGFWASVGFLSTHTSYSASKFAVKGFTEALINDFKLNAPHVRAAIVMPGHIGTSIAANIMGELTPAKLAEQRAEAAKRARVVGQMRGTKDYEKLERMGQLRGYLKDLSHVSDEQLQKRHQQAQKGFSTGGTSAEKAAEIILSGVRQGKWRILVGPDAYVLDEAVRKHPEEAYEADFNLTVIKVAKEQRQSKAAPPPAARM